MKPESAAPQPAFFDELRRRRAELLDSMRALEQALSAPAPGRAGRWAERVHVALVELDADFREHVAITEGAGGLYGDLLATAPRLTGQVARLTREHATIKEHIGEALTSAGSPDVSDQVDQVDQVREEATALLTQLLHHRQRGSDLVFEAYAVDIGGET